MAHINKAARDAIDVSPVGAIGFRSSRELSYAVMTLMERYVGNDPGKYQEVLGAVETAKQEFYRTKIKPYERQCQFENGNI
jgi:hypothetical protein